MGSFFIPVSGLQAAQQQLESVSNNLANIDTDGYKDQNLTFADVYSQTDSTNGSGDPLQTGSGVKVQQTVSNFTEGTVSPTGIPSNMAINGNGFFVTQGSGGAYNYTRSGDFTVNKAGQIEAPDGSLVMGYPATNGVINSTGGLKPLVVGTGIVSPAVTSTTITTTANLDASAAVGSTDATTSSSVPVYDSLGTAQPLSLTFTKTAANTWSYQVTIPGANLSPASSGTTTVASGTLNFNSSGTLVSTEPTGGTATVAPSSGIAISLPPTGTTFADGAASMNLNWSLVSAGAPTITESSATSGISAATTDGFPSGTLSNYSIGNDGTITGSFTSGETLDIGQVALANFANVQGLADVGNNNYNVTSASGPAVTGSADSGGRGTISGGSTEASNVDIATEFARMIISQQAYSANAKSVTTFNQVSQATLAMIQ